MPKKESAKDRKQQRENEAKLNEKAKKEEAQWSVGTKTGSSKQDEKEQKRLEKLQKKQEAAKLLEEEEKSLGRGGKAAKGKAPKKESYAASSIEDAITLMEGLGEKSKSLDEIDRHPERRAKAAFAVFEERELTRLKIEEPSLRLSQMKQLIAKLWIKAPENPFNQLHASYNASKEDLTNLKNKKVTSDLERLRID